MKWEEADKEGKKIERKEKKGNEGEIKEWTIRED